MQKGSEKMLLEQVRNSNSHLNILSVDNEKFKSYGRLLKGYDTKELSEYVDSSFTIPSSGSIYVPSIPELEQVSVIQKLFKDIYGGLEVQAGICAGKNKVFNGAEFHQGSETVVALTDCVLFVGEKKDMVGQTYNGKLSECFFLEKGQVIEMYDTTLHYAPCNVDKYFVTIVILLKGTNTPLESSSGLLTKKNKWFITHKSVEAKVNAGCVAGFLGEINYIN